MFKLAIYSLAVSAAGLAAGGIGRFDVGGIVLVGAILLASACFLSLRQKLVARRDVKKIYRDYPRNDGTPRYDDIWGAQA